MVDQILTFLDQGLLHLSGWQIALVALICVQITIASVTLFLHRSQAHRGVDFHPILNHFFRFWLWSTTGMVTKEWVSIHRKHHVKCETEEDPHSPVFYGINKVLWDGVALYREESHNQETMDKYGQGTPDDFLERKLYSRFPVLGIASLMIIDVLLFGVAGFAVWAVQMAWIPFWAAGVINGLGHWWGYRNYENADTSTNLTPVALWVGGEELHNNHHAFPNSCKFSLRKWEFDIGWLYIRTLSILGLAKVRTVAPTPRLNPAKQGVDLETLRAVIVGRVHVMANYAKQVTVPVLRESSAAAGRKAFKHLKTLLVREQSMMDDNARDELQDVLKKNAELDVVYQYRLRLQELWGKATASQDAMVQALKEWCAQAEATGIKSLQEFARSLQSYSLQAKF